MGEAGERRSRGVAVRLLALLMGLVLGSAAVLSGQDVVDRVRADRPLTGVTVGEPGCVTSARVVTPDGAERTVSLLPPRASCLARDPGGSVTVWMDPDDPSTLVPSRAWWWPASLALLGMVVAAASAVVVVRGPAVPATFVPTPRRGGRRPGGARALAPRRTPVSSSVSSSEPVPLDVDDAGAAYRWDHVLGRAEVVGDRLQDAGASAAVVAGVGDLARHLKGGDLAAARDTARRLETRSAPASVRPELDDLLARVLAGGR